MARGTPGSTRSYPAASSTVTVSRSWSPMVITARSSSLRTDTGPSWAATIGGSAKTSPNAAALPPSLRRGGGKSGAHASVARVDLDGLAGLGVLESDDPGLGQDELARVVQHQRDDVVLVRQRPKRRLEGGIEEVGDHEDDGALLGDVPEEVRGRADVGPAARRSGVEELADHVERVVATHARRDVLLHRVREQEQRDAVVVAQRGDGQ